MTDLEKLRDCLLSATETETWLTLEQLARLIGISFSDVVDLMAEVKVSSGIRVQVRQVCQYRAIPK